MCKKPKDESIKKVDPENRSPEDSNWETDQREHGYYYDDAYGYQKYVPEENAGNDEEE
ncbi:MAG: hypothetical protein R2681_01330 [Pyrinomonadaceae bacterium]